MRRSQRNRRWTIAGVATLGLLGLLPIAARFTGSAATADVALPGDGTTSATAGASCWGIKQAYPTVGDGVYWLSNSSMDRPASFWCDMTTDGGGWVLVARGRDGWTFNPNGQGSPTTIRTTPDGTGAFAPAALDSTTIDELYGTTAQDSNVDGIRLRRATSADGNTRQEIRLFSPARRWTWNLAAGQLMNKVVVNGTTYNGSNTQDTAITVTGQVTNGLAGVNDNRRIWTSIAANKNSRQGFGLGALVLGGSSSATSYLWTNASEGSPLGFTQVFIRPRIANDAAGFSALPADGLPAQAKPLSLKNRSEFAPWGVVGADHSNETSSSPWYANVLSVQAYGDRVFVGGRFTGVQQGPGGRRHQPPVPRRLRPPGQLDQLLHPDLRRSGVGHDHHRQRQADRRR